jgi:hypothetical protein
LYDESTLKEVKVKLNNSSGATISGVIKNVILKDGSTVLGTRPLNETSQVNDDGEDTISNSATTFTGLAVIVPANETKILTVDLELDTPVADVSTSQVDVAMTLDSVKYANSQGTQTTDTTDKSGNKILVYKSIPVVEFQTLSSGQGINLAAGSTTEIYKFKVTATGNDLALKQIRFSTTITDNSGAGTKLDTFKFFRDGTDITTSAVTIQNTSGDSLESATDLVGEGTTDIIVTFDTEQAIAAGTSKIFALKATPTAFTTSNGSADSVTTSIPGTTDTAAHNGKHIYVFNSETGSIHQLATDADGDDATDYDFIWSDKSALSHSYTSTSSSKDWANGYSVLNLPLDSAGISTGQ